jgi:predicted RNase H-like HicB family nuclease
MIHHYRALYYKYRVGQTHHKFTAIVEQDGPWYVAYCGGVPDANGQGITREECLANLREG